MLVIVSSLLHSISNETSCHGFVTMASIVVRQMSEVWVSDGLGTKEHKRRHGDIAWFRQSRPYVQQ